MGEVTPTSDMKAEGVKYLKRAINLLPSNLEFRLELFHFYLKENNNDEAKLCRDEILNQLPKCSLKEQKRIKKVIRDEGRSYGLEWKN